jgi:Holliday junction resolvase
MFSTGGRVIVSQDAAWNLNSLVNFVSGKQTSPDVLLITEKLFFPVEIQLIKGQSVFISLEQTSPFVVFYEELSATLAALLV